MIVVRFLAPEELISEKKTLNAFIFSSSISWGTKVCNALMASSLVDIIVLLGGDVKR
jgi:hypothetical protein